MDDRPQRDSGVSDDSWQEVGKLERVEDLETLRGKLCFLAGPLRGGFIPENINDNMSKATHIQAMLFRQGIFTLSPHSNTGHFILINVKEGGLSCTEDEVEGHYCRLLSDCDVILLIPGWEESNGCKKELWFARKWGVTPYELSTELVSAL